jgi:uncharacterized protein YecE (DUF72 family)
MGRPAMGKILVGTTSWTEKTLIDSGLFYPPEVKTAEDRLRYYATKFAITEVDSSYYALPSERNAQIWVERTPENFTFHIKAFRLFTGHQTAPSALPQDIREAIGPTEKKNVYYKDLPKELADALWERFRAALQPLQAARKLGAIVFQFPHWFIPNRAGYAHIVSSASPRGTALSRRGRRPGRSWWTLSGRPSVCVFRISRASRATASGVVPQRESGLPTLHSDAPNG